MLTQHNVALQHDYTFLRTSAQVRKFVDAGYLVRMPGNVDYDLAGVSYPYGRPAMKLFVERLASQYRASCGEKLVVTSLTRPIQRQPSNASDLSVHPAGMAVDMRVSRNAACRRWLETTLLSLERQGVLDATRENYPPHYHVALYPTSYTQYVARLTSRSTVQLASNEASSGQTSASGRSASLEATESTRSSTTVATAALEEAGSTDSESAGVGATDAPAPGETPGPGSTAGTAFTEDAGAQTVREYRVNRGDSLWSISRRHGTTVEALQQMNGLASASIRAGDIIKVPAVNATSDDADSNTRR